MKAVKQSVEGMYMTEERIAQIARTVARCPFVRGVVLGGSRATGSATADSDVDIGVYYDPAGFDAGQLSEAARELDDAHRPGLVCGEGGWGGWVNCGGWLTVDGCPVDLICRDAERVRRAVEETDAGRFSAHYQPGHPHAYLDVMYRGELACAKALCVPDAALLALKARAQAYPEALRGALLDFFLFEADFSLAMARKSARGGDVYYVCGQLFRTVSALNQALFALNRAYLLNEKKATLRAEGLARVPPRYRERAEAALSLSRERLAQSVEALAALCAEVRALAERGADGR